MRLGKWLERKNLGVTEFAEQIGVTQSTVSRILQGDPPNLRTAARVVAATGGEVAWRDMLPRGFARTLGALQRRFHARAVGEDESAAQQ